jgi:methionyl-tRNA formyltransferase
MHNKISFAFFGTPRFARIILDELESAGFLPHVVISGEDKPQGRGLQITSSETKTWAEKRGIKVLQPKTLRDGALTPVLKEMNLDLFIVASYGKIIPKDIIELPKYKTLNVHPSLLPKLRGAAPIESAILSEEKTGVTIMRIDEEMDHGPLLAQEDLITPEWPIPAPELEDLLAHQGGRLLARVFPDWIEGKIPERAQDHIEATFTKKITKEDGLIDLNAEPKENFRKICAFAGWPGTYFFFEGTKGKIRVVIKNARLKEGRLEILRVIPEGRKEMSWEDFLRGFDKH